MKDPAMGDIHPNTKEAQVAIMDICPTVGDIPSARSMVWDIQLAKLMAVDTYWMARVVVTQPAMAVDTQFINTIDLLRRKFIPHSNQTKLGWEKRTKVRNIF